MNPKYKQTYAQKVVRQSYRLEDRYAIKKNGETDRETGSKKRDLVHFLVKSCLIKLMKIIKLMLILGQVRLSKGQLCQAGLGKRLGQTPQDQSPPQGLEIGKTPLQIIFKPAINREVHLIPKKTFYRKTTGKRDV